MEHKKHHHNHSHHLKEFRKKFWISFVLTIPVLILSETIQDILNFIEGSLDVNQSFLTGESKHIGKKPADKLIGIII